MSARAAPSSIGERLSAADLADLGALLPGSAADLIACVGTEPALALLNAWPGVTINVPKTPDSNPRGAQRWAQLQAIVGADAMLSLAARYGGQPLEVATCEALRTERRRRWMRAHYDRITSADATLTKAAAVHELGLALAAAGQPMSSRAIEIVLDSADAAGAAPAAPRSPARGDARQGDLFTTDARA